MKKLLMLGTALSAAMLMATGPATAQTRDTLPGAGDRMYENQGEQGNAAQGVTERDLPTKPNAPGAGDRMYENQAENGKAAHSVNNPNPAIKPNAPGAGDRMYEKKGLIGLQDKDMASLRPGMDVINGSGHTIGEVAKVDGDKIVVSVGDFLGIGDREIALKRENLTLVGTGGEAKLRTTLSEDTLKAMPKYDEKAM